MARKLTLKGEILFECVVFPMQIILCFTCLTPRILNRPEPFALVCRGQYNFSKAYQTIIFSICLVKVHDSSDGPSIEIENVRMFERVSLHLYSTQQCL